ncbi:MAG: hypothetical protein WBA88_15625, partial [Pseudaminobacter sp.]
MQTIADLIDAAKKRTGANYTDISERLDRSKQLITNWRSGKKVPTDGDILALARMAGENADKWLAIAQAARTEGEAKTRWEQIARRLAAVTAGIGVIALAYFHRDMPRALMALVPVAVTDPLYIMRNGGDVRRTAAARSCGRRRRSSHRLAIRIVSRPV